MTTPTYHTLARILTQEFRCPPDAIRPESGFGELGLDCSGRRTDFVCAAEDALRLRIPDAPLATPAGWTLGRMCSVIDEVMARDGAR